MGGSPSKPVLKDKPWREIKGWDESAKNQLQAEINSLFPKSSLQIPSYNILFAGLIGAGKSSFVNSITGVLRGSVYSAAAAGAGQMADSLTKEFNIYQVLPDLPFRISDTMGINEELDISNVMRAVEGHVPDGYEFTPGQEFKEDNPAYIADPKPADIAHCVAIVVNSKSVAHLSPDMTQKLKTLAKHLYDKKITFVVLLTHLDEYCKEVEEDVTTMFHSIAVEELVVKMSKMVNGLPENHIYPIINYTKPVDLKTNIDVLLLYALRHMLGVSQGYIEKLEKKLSSPTSQLETSFSELKFGQQEEEGKEEKKVENMPCEDEEVAQMLT